MLLYCKRRLVCNVILDEGERELLSRHHHDNGDGCSACDNASRWSCFQRGRRASQIILFAKRLAHARNSMVGNKARSKILKSFFWNFQKKKQDSTYLNTVGPETPVWRSHPGTHTGPNTWLVFHCSIQFPRLFVSLVVCRRHNYQNPTTKGSEILCLPLDGTIVLLVNSSSLTSWIKYLNKKKEAEAPSTQIFGGDQSIIVRCLVPGLTSTSS